MSSIKYITEMNDQEILALTEDDIKRMIQLKMMQEGIKILVRPEEPTYATVPSKDMIAYKVKVGYSNDYILYADREAAQRVLEAIRAEAKSLRKTEYMSGASYERTLREYGDNIDMNVEEERFYSAALYEKVRGATEGNKKLKENYDKELSAYNENHSAAQWIRDEVNDKYDEVSRKHRSFGEMLAKFHEYLDLADDNGTQATTFFIKAYAPDRETMEFLAEKTDGKFELPALPEQPAE